MDTTLIIGILIVVLALVFDFSNGFNDSANIVATVIGTRALTPAKAIFFACIFEFIGAYFLGTAVAKTIGKGIIDPMIITGDKYGIIIIFATVISAAGWNIICTVLGFPTIGLACVDRRFYRSGSGCRRSGYCSMEKYFNNIYIFNRRPGYITRFFIFCDKISIFFCSRDNTENQQNVQVSGNLFVNGICSFTRHK